MPRSIIVLLFVVFTTNLFSQKQDVKYTDRAGEIQSEIWSNPSAPFKVTKVPAAMDSESAVVIARTFEVINSAKAKLKFGLGFTQRISYQTTIHERVKINDKSALDDYSSLEYTKKLDLTYSRGFSKIYNKM